VYYTNLPALALLAPELQEFSPPTTDVLLFLKMSKKNYPATSNRQVLSPAKNSGALKIDFLIENTENHPAFKDSPKKPPLKHNPKALSHLKYRRLPPKQRKLAVGRHLVSVFRMSPN
jgi:hypothetical protein